MPISKSNKHILHAAEAAGICFNLITQYAGQKSTGLSMGTEETVFVTELIQPQTERLQLRQWIESDLDPFAVMSADPRVMEFFPKTLSRGESNGVALKCRSLLAQRGWGVWAVELRETRQFIGMVGLHTPSADLPFSPCIEVLWRLAPAYWGQGYATEAAKAALKVGFDVLAVDEIVSFAVVGNTRSRAVMERLNMVNAGGTFFHPDLPTDSPLREHCLYKISRE